MLMTVSMGFLLNPEANLLVAISFFYIGIGLFQAAVLANGPYNKNYLRYSRSYYCAQATLYLAALILFFGFRFESYNSAEYCNHLRSSYSHSFYYFYVTQNKNIPNLTGGSFNEFIT